VDLSLSRGELERARLAPALATGRFDPLAAVADKMQRCTVLWTVSDRDPTLGPHDAGLGLDPGPRMRSAPAYQVPERLGFHVVERWQFNFAQVTKSTR
jgi:mannosyltransferase